MTQIERETLDSGIELAIAALQERGIAATIIIRKLPENDVVEQGGFAKLIFFDSHIDSLYLTEELNFSVPIPVATHRNPEDWAWVVVEFFLGEAVRKVLVKEGLSDNFKEFRNIYTDLTDEMIKDAQLIH